MALLFRCRADQKVYNATTGTTAASDGGAVGSWEPSDGLITTRLLHATKGPTYRANDNSSGYPGLEWSAGKLLTLAHSSYWTGWSSLSWLVVARNLDSPSSSTYRYLWGKGTSAGSWNNIGCRINNASFSEDVFTWHDAGYAGRKCSETTPTETASVRYVLAGSANSSKICTYVNLQSSSRRAISQSISVGTAQFVLGEDAEGSGTYNLTQGVVFEIAVWNAALTESEMATEIGNAMTRWGVTNTADLPTTSSGGIVLPSPFAAGIMGF